VEEEGEKRSATDASIAAAKASFSSGPACAPGHRSRVRPLAVVATESFEWGGPSGVAPTLWCRKPDCRRSAWENGRMEREGAEEAVLGGGGLEGGKGHEGRGRG
jgi:hypothetical protein